MFVYIKYYEFILYFRNTNNTLFDFILPLLHLNISFSSILSCFSPCHCNLKAVLPEFGVLCFNSIFLNGDYILLNMTCII